MPQSKDYAALIEKWKTQHGAVLKYETEDGKVAFFRYPTRKEVAYSTSIITQNDVLKSAEVLLNACYLGGDREILDDDAYFYGLQEWAGMLIKKKQGRLQMI